MTKMRAFVTEETAQSVEARFTYLGETAQTAALGSGAIRRAIWAEIAGAGCVQPCVCDVEVQSEE